MIGKITKAYTRTYSDNGQRKTYIEWLDYRGKPGRTEGDKNGLHIQALLKRAEREGVKHRVETW